MRNGSKYLLTSAIGIGLMTGCNQWAAPENALQPEEKCWLQKPSSLKQSLRTKI